LAGRNDDATAVFEQPTMDSRNADDEFRKSSAERDKRADADDEFHDRLSVAPNAAERPGASII
jgi:hypothetical protein